MDAICSLLEQEFSMMDEMVGYCGYKCHLCAARSEDPAIRQKMIDGWKKFYGLEKYTVENVQCDGCLSDGKIADKECKARPCAREKGIKSCAFCEEFPCDKVRHLLATREGLLLFCFPKTSNITREEYDLCMRQFTSMGGLIKILADNGKLPKWCGQVKSSSD